MLSGKDNHQSNIITIDHGFLGIPGTIASYLIPHDNGAILIESGPDSTRHNLIENLRIQGLNPEDITDILLTHIHLDHAGAAGWFSQLGSRIHVHEVGAPHLIDPQKLLASAERIYGNQMDELWGKVLPVKESCIRKVNDGDIIEIEGLQFRALDTPGHANHHHAFLFEDICFTGDIGGIRIQNQQHIRLPMPPPEFHLESWRQSLTKLIIEFQSGSFTRIAPTHFGTFDDPEWHLASIAKSLDEIELWIETTMAGDPSLDKLNQEFLNWTKDRSLADGIDPKMLNAYEAANPSWMSSYGIQRYWNKFRRIP